MSSSDLPTVGSRSTLDPELEVFFSKNPDLHLGWEGCFTAERSHHTRVFGFHALPTSQQGPIQEVEFTAIRGPDGTIPIRILYQKSGEEKRKSGDAAALIYFHGGGYTVGIVDEFENGLRIVAEESGVQVYAVEYRLAPEWRFPTQLDEYVAVAKWLHGEGGKARGVHMNKVLGGGNSAGGNMTAAVSLRLRDEGKKPLKAQILLYPEARLPLDMNAATENNTGMYVSPGMQPIDYLKGVPPAANFTCGFDPLRDVGVEYGSKLKQAVLTLRGIILML
ncbi:Arylesterase [Lachnellula cervina]|uniref:Arylesterase n=1 Tax=Lachnellula cervina TaxID=1316786 RepID=A0A7D8Z2T6_9HELO|nr:Arylesterase [Lachnellula cervina]